jgi:hypothetical protein
MSTNINERPSPGNSRRGTNAALFEKLSADLKALARRYAGEPVCADILRMADQAGCIASRAGAR